MPTEEQKIARIAAGLAMSNFGCQLPNEIANHPECWSPTAWAEICSLAGHLMENSEHEEIFCEEAAMWEKQIQDVGLAAYIEQPWLKQKQYEWIHMIAAVT
jgi:hypothetical protein